MVHVYGYTPAEICALTIMDLRPEELRRLVSAQMALAETRRLSYETTHLDKDGRAYRVEVESYGAMLEGAQVLEATIRPAPDDSGVDAPPADKESAARSTAWRDDLEIGVQELDHQHKLICAIIGQLRDGMKHGRLWNVNGVLAALRAQVNRHFETEEREMERVKYPGLGSQRLAHDEFRAQLAVQKLQLETSFTPGQSPKPRILVATYTFVEPWYVRRYAREYEGKAVNVVGSVVLRACSNSGDRSRTGLLRESRAAIGIRFKSLSYEDVSFLCAKSLSSWWRSTVTLRNGRPSLCATDILGRDLP